jgi:hypothetical protein
MKKSEKQQKELLEEAKIIEKSAAWWVSKTQSILDEIDRLEASEYYEGKEIDLENSYNELKIFLARKKIEQNKIDSFLKKIATINQNDA